MNVYVMVAATIALVSIHSEASAQNESNQNSPAQAGQKAKYSIPSDPDSQKRGLDDSSKSMRENKRYGIHIGFGGRVIGPTEAVVSGNLFLNPSEIVQLNYINLDSAIESNYKESDGSIGSTSLIRTDVEGFALGLLYKKFEGNSFYWAAGVDYSQASGTFVIDTSFLNESDDIGDYQRLSLDIRIGNQWQWQNFTLGTDWVGVLIPAIVQKDYKIDSQDIGPIEEFQKSGTATNLTGLRFYIGWSL